MSNPFDQFDSAKGLFDDLIPTGNSNGIVTYVSHPVESGPTIILQWLAVLLPLCVLALFAWLIWRQRDHIVYFWRQRARQILIALAAGLFIVSGLFPPWRIIVKDRSGHTRFTHLQNSWLFDNPKIASEYYQSSAIAADVLAVEWVLMAGCAGVLWWLGPRRNDLP